MIAIAIYRRWTNKNTHRPLLITRWFELFIMRLVVTRLLWLLPRQLLSRLRNEARASILTNFCERRCPERSSQATGMSVLKNISLICFYDNFLSPNRINSFLAL